MTLVLELPRSLESAAAARHAVDDLEGVPEDVLGDIRLMVSELVTNSLRHAGLSDEDRIKLRVEVSESSVRVEVRDPGQGFSPPETASDPADADGWGLYLVATLADRWGVESEDATLVWFELDRAA